MPPMNATYGQHTPDYFILRDVTKSGPVLGFYRGVEINQFVTDRWHRSFEFVGVSMSKPDGGLDCDALSPGEFVLKPGLVYRMLKS